jgi:hypothetical protein
MNFLALFSSMAAGKDETSASTGEVETVKAEAEVVKAAEANGTGETVKAEVVEAVEANGTGAAESSPVIEPRVTSFKEESNFVSDLKESERKALQELKCRIEEAILKNEFSEHENEKSDGKDGETKETEAEKPADEKEAEKELKVVETVTEIDIKDGDVVVKNEETEVAVTEELSDKKAVEEQGPKAEESVAVETVTVSSETLEVSASGAKNASEATAVESEAVTGEQETVEVTVETFEAETEKFRATDVYLWGVPLLHTKGDERTDVILLKFLRARDFKVQEAFEMLKNTVLWRKSFKTDSILEEDFGNDLDGVAYMNGYDKEGHPVCYNVYGVFQDKELYQKTFGTEEKRQRFLRWRVQLLEKGIEQLSFSPGGVNSMVQITDLKNSPGPGKKELRQATKQALDLLQDNYPEFVARKIFINVPWWYLALSTMISPFITQRTKSKFVIARASRVTETLFKYISPEYVPVQYGGLNRENDQEFSGADGGVTELIIKAGTKQIIDIPATEVGTSLVWDLTVVGWEVSYKEEFIPSAEGCYTVIIQKEKKMAAQEEAVRNSFKIGEVGKVVLTIDNLSSRKKKLIYRSKVKRHL